MLPLVLFLAFCDFALAFPKLPGFNLLPGKRNVFEERQAEAQPTCSCESVDPVASAFIGHAPFAAAASAAPTPSGYVNAFTNENSYCNAEGGRGFTTLDAYDSELCADLCKSVEGCTAFTLYYEKDATTNYRGTDVGSSASIKCAFWSGSLAPRGSSSRGSDAYNAIVAGSNGYNQVGPNVATSGSSSASTGAFGTGVGGQDSSASASIIPTSPGWTDGHGGPHGSRPVSLSPTTSGSPATDAGHGSRPGGPSTPSSLSSVSSMSTSSGTGAYGAHGGPGGHSSWTSEQSTVYVPVSSTSTTTTHGHGTYTHSSTTHSFSPTVDPTSSSMWTSTPSSTSAAGPSNPSTSSSTTVQGTYTHSWTTTSGAHGYPWGSHVTVSSSSYTASSTTSTLSSSSSAPSNGYSFQITNFDTKRGKREVSYLGFYDGSAVEVDTLAEAATFQLQDGQLRMGDNYLGTDSSSGYEAMVLFDEAPKVSNGWTIGSGQTLEFHNQDFTFGGGQAGFCSSTYGSLYIEFTDEPSFICNEVSFVGVAPASVSTTTSGTSSSWSSSTIPHGTSSLLTTVSSTPGWPGQAESQGTGHYPTTTKGQPYSTTPSSSLTTTTYSGSSSTTTSTVAEPTGSTNESYSGNWTHGGGIPPIFLNSTHLIYNATTNMVYCEWTGLWYPYTANFSLASLNLTGGWNYTLPSNTTDVPTTTTALPSNTTTASPTETSGPASNGTGSGNSTYGGGYGNFTIPPIFLNSTHLIYNATTNMVYCEWTGLWYPYTANFSLASLNWTSSVNYTLPSNTTDIVNVTSTSTTSELPSTTTSSPTETSAPASNTTTYDNSTGYPVGYNTSIPWHMTWNPSNQSWYCNLTGLWYPSGANFSIPGYNFTEPSNSTEVNATTSTVSPTTSSTTPSPTPSDVVSPDNTTSNYTGSPAGYNFTGLPFNMSHMVYNPSNNSWYCELTHLWYPADGNWSLSDFNITLPSYNYTSNGTYPAANWTTSSIVADATSTENPTSTSSTPADATETVSNSTGVTYPSYNATGTWSIADFNSSHLIYSASNNSIFCTITGLWYPAGNFSLASLNLTGNWTDSSYGSNYTLPSNATDASNSSSTSVGPSETSTTTSSETPSATPAPDNSTTSLNSTGVTYPSFNYSSIPFNESHFIYNPSNDSLYCELTGLWYPAGNVSNIPGFNISTISIFNGTWPSYNYTLPSNTTVDATNATASPTTSSSSDIPSATPAPDNSTVANATYTGGNSSYGLNYTLPSFNWSSVPSHMIYSPGNNSWYCELTGLWYPANDTSWLSGLYPPVNGTGYSFNSSSYGSNSTIPDNSTTVEPTSTSSTSSASDSPTPTPDSSVNSTNSSSGWDFSSYPSFNVSALNSSHLIFAANGSVFCEYTQQWYLPNDTSWLAYLNATYSSFNSSAYDANSTYGANSTIPDNSTSVETTSTTSSISPTPTPDSSANSTNSSSPSFSSYPSFNVSALNSSHLIFAANGSVYCEYTGLWYLPNDTSWLALLNATYPSFNASAYGSNYTAPDNSTTVEPTSTTSSSVSNTPKSTPDSSANSTTNSSVYPSYNGTYPSIPSFNLSALNSSSDHLIFYPNGSVWCDYTETLYGPNDTSWLSLLNATYPSFNSSGYSLNSTYNTNTTIPDNSTVTSTVPSSTTDSPTPTPTPDDSSNSTSLNSTGVFPVSAYNSSHLYFAPNGSVYCYITGLWYPANDTSWESFLNGTYPSFNSSSYNDTSYSLNSTDANSTTTSSTSSAIDTPTPTPDASSNTTVTNSTGVPGVFPNYNISAIANSTDHLIFYANGSVWCDYTQTLYAANDTSWESFLNGTYPSFNASSYGGYNDTGYSLNSTLGNSTDVNATLTSTTSSTVDMPTPTPDTSNTTVANFTGVFPQLNSTVPPFNVSALNSSDHLIFYPNGSVWCDYTQTLYSANDTSWLSLLNYTSSAFNASAYGGFNSTAYLANSTSAGNATSTNTTSTEPTDSATPTPEPAVNASVPVNSTAGVFPSYNITVPPFNVSALNASDHLIFYPNGSVWCDYTQELYPANDTSWLSLLNYTGAGYSYNSTYLNTTTPVDNSTILSNATSTSSMIPTPTPAPVDNSTIPVNTTGVFPSLPFNISAIINSTDHLIFYANGSVWCDYTDQLYAANDTSWLSLLNYTSTGYSYNSTGYSYNSTNLNFTTPVENATSVEPVATSTSSDIPTATPTPVDNTSIPLNSTGVFPSYNGSSFNISAIVNASDHLIFYANGSVFCDYTGLLYGPNDTSWMSLLNYTSAGYSLNATGYSLNSTGYSYNSTYLDANSTSPATPTPTPTPAENSTIPAPVDNSTIPGIFPSYNSSSFNISAILNITDDHLIFYSNGSVFCEYTQQLYGPNDTSWMSLLNYTSAGYAPANLTGGYVFNSTTDDDTSNSTAGYVPTPAPAQAASSTGYVAPTASSWSNGTTTSSTALDSGNSTGGTDDGSGGVAKKVKRWNPPKDRRRFR